MRSLLMLLAMASLLACGPQQPDNADGGTEAGSTPCDGKKDCTSCQACAAQVQCAAFATACQQNSACIGLDQCIKLCGADTACEQECYTNNADGITAYYALTSCLVCQECPSDCAGYKKCG